MERRGAINERLPLDTARSVVHPPDCVTIRDQKVELSEVEQAMARFPSVARAAVCAWQREPEPAQLAAYVVLHPRYAPSARSLRRALRTSLPHFMIPSQIVFVEDLPLTPQGTIDRERLTGLEPRREPAAYQTETEAKIAGFWREAFDIPAIERHDDFFDLGGDSLNALDIASRIQSALGVEMPAGEFVNHPSLAEFAAAVDRKREIERDSNRVPLARVPRGKPLPVTFQQEWLWNFSQTPRAARAYTLTFIHRIDGPLDPDLLRDCLNELIARHEPFRTTFAVIDGTLHQIVHPPQPVDWCLVDLAARPDADKEADRLFREYGTTVFDLARLPLVKFRLLRLRPDHHRLVSIIQHVLVDQDALDRFYEQVGLTYQARVQASRPAEPDQQPLQYADYAVWQRRMYAKGDVKYDQTIEYWQKTLAGAPATLPLPFGRAPARTDADPAEGHLFRDMDQDVARDLEQIGRSEASSYFIVRLAAFIALLGDVTGQPDLVVGTYVTTRTRLALQHMMGLFSCLVVLRFRFDAGHTFRDWLLTVRDSFLEQAAHAALPYEEVGAELQRRGAPSPAISAIVSPWVRPDPVLFAGLTLVRSFS